MMHPIIGGMHSSTMTGPFFFNPRARNAPPMVAISCTAPNGMLKRIVWNESKPKDFTMSGPNVDMPPEGILAMLVTINILYDRTWLTRSKRVRQTSTTSSGRSNSPSNDPTAIPET